MQDQYLEELTDIQELKGNKNRAAIVRNIQKVEALNLTYGHIKYVVKEVKHMNVTQVQYPTTTHWETTKDNDELEQKILQQQHEHFTQANPTPIEQHFMN